MSYDLKQKSDGEIFAEMARIATQFSGVVPHQCELQRRNTVKVCESLDALSAAVSVAAEKSDRLARVAAWLNGILVLATIAGVAAAIFTHGH